MTWHWQNAISDVPVHRVEACMQVERRVKCKGRRTNISLLEFASKMPSDESCLADTSIADQDHFELRNCLRLMARVF